MTDQAATLRALRGGLADKERDGDRPPPSIAPLTGRVIAIGGGKGGVGKSTLAVNLAVAYAQANLRTLIVDSDLGMADLNLLLGVAPEKSILDALGGTAIEDILVKAHGLELLPALNGSYLLSTLGPAGHRKLLDLVARTAAQFATVIVDVAAGIGQTQTMFAGAAAETIVVVNPEPLSMADAYASLKVLAVETGLRHAYVVPNRVVSRTQADEVTGRLGALVARFLDLKITALPPIPADPTVALAAQIGVPLLVHAPDSPAARAIRHLTRALAGFTSPTQRFRTQGATR